MSILSAAIPESRPVDIRSGARVAVFLTAAAILLLSAAGVTSPALFREPNTLKYVVTVVGPALVAGLALSRQPMRLLVAFAIVVAPFDFEATLGGLQVTPLLAVLVLAVLLAALTRRASRSGWLGRATAAAVLLLVPAIASADAPASYALWLAETVAMGWLVFGVAREPGGTRLVLAMIVLSAFIQGLLSFYEYRSGHQLNLYNGSAVSSAGASYFWDYGNVIRSSGALPDPISLGNVLALATPLILALGVLDRRRRVRLVLALAGGVTMIGTVLTFSRMSWVGAAVGLLVAIILLPRRAILPAAASVVAISALVVTLSISLGGSQLHRRFESLLNPTKTASSYVGTARGDLVRERLWTAALATAAAHPITGTGFGRLTPELNEHGVSVPDAAHAQSWYLELLGEGGALAALALLGVIGATARDLAVGFSRNRTVVAGAAGAVAAVLITWTTDISPRYVQVSAMIAALLGVVAAQAVEEPSPRRDQTDSRHALPLVLASPSPERAAILGNFGVPFAVGARPANQPWLPDVVPAHPVRRAIATARADPVHLAIRGALRDAIAAVPPRTPQTTLGVHTLLVADDGRVLRAPPDEDQARAMLRAAGATVQQIVSAVVLLWPDGVRCATAITAVTLRNLSDAEIDAYLATGEWRGQPGGYSIYGAGALLVDSVAGEYENALGLPVAALLGIYPRITECE